ncbi:DUF6461 domain-containing protein [Streptosporangium fragile]|uniref:DUF6461 domain-containing protein n=1 Tax=Streptosporangium fragile TaxID=46186 RepID=UPI0031EBC43E
MYKETIRSVFENPACLTWVHSENIRDVVQAFGGQPEQLAEGGFDDLYESYELDNDEAIVLITQSPGWFLAVEFTKYMGARRDVLRRLSAGGEALTLAWTIELDATFAYAADGKLESVFDPVRQGTTAAEPEYLAWAQAYGVTAEQWRDDWLAASFALAEQISGLRVDQTWKERTHLVLSIERQEAGEPAARPPLALKEEMWELVMRHPRVAAIAANPSEDDFTEMSLIASEMVVRAAGLEGPDIDEALNAIGAGRHGESVRALNDRLLTLSDGFRRRAAEVMDENANAGLPDPDTDWGRFLMKHHALKTLAAPLAMDPYPGCKAAIRQAREVVVGQRRQNDNYRLLKAMENIAFYMFNGHNP